MNEGESIIGCINRLEDKVDLILEILQKKRKTPQPTKAKEYDAFLGECNRIFKREYRGDGKSMRQFGARIKEGFTVKNLTDAMTAASLDDYHQKTEFKYATPEYFTRSNIIDKWLANYQHINKVKPPEYFSKFE